ncbi:hypothetical protein CLV86_1177 [Lacinutrix venerupis]|uniref:Nicotinic acid mononucleotide adenyltransferase n=1 Tax=Lacinutrix venerupis TaxID=1486034 RepID=A0AAC9LKG7_9FLAO|nr:nicotinic acid mononucleotide adenyltransferase [Lacinutrix venerupis]APX99222.1 nicotinic acid mononucleotide adenyltransferase [Lacinutrix venerupis]RLJ65600.1 hypothetical protein CLV86_1177 [Lacinutrix venerupis]
MKNILALILMFAVSFTFAQDVKPKFEKKGNQTEATFYHDNGEVAQTGFFNKDNKLEGTWTSFDAEGNKVAVGKYDNGIKVGKWFFWNKETLKEVDYLNNNIASVSEWENKSTVAIRD